MSDSCLLVHTDRRHALFACLPLLTSPVLRSVFKPFVRMPPMDIAQSLKREAFHFPSHGSGSLRTAAAGLPHTTAEILCCHQMDLTTATFYSFWMLRNAGKGWCRYTERQGVTFLAKERYFPGYTGWPVLILPHSPLQLCPDKWVKVQTLFSPLSRVKVPFCAEFALLVAQQTSSPNTLGYMYILHLFFFPCLHFRRPLPCLKAHWMT